MVLELELELELELPSERTMMKSALIIGGTQFIGRHCVERLLKNGGWNVWLLNRGKTPSPFSVSEERVQYCRCDRLNDGKAFRRHLASRSWDLVVDFVCFCAENARDAVKGLERDDGSFDTKLYVLISTDSVYMATNAIDSRAITEDASARNLRPTTVSEITSVRNHDAYQFQYGNGKLGAEDVLLEAYAESGFPATILRLPDVFGEYNNLDGFLDLFNDIEAGRCVASKPGWNKRDGNKYPKSWVKEHRISMVYAPDVASAVVACFNDPAKVAGHAFHIASGIASIWQVYEQVRSSLNKLRESRGLPPCAPLVPDYSRSVYFPSVDIGPLCIKKAQRLLGWAPTPISEWLHKSVEWYTDERNKEYSRRLAESSSDSDSDSESDSDNKGSASFKFNFFS